MKRKKEIGWLIAALIRAGALPSSLRSLDRRQLTVEDLQIKIKGSRGGVKPKKTEVWRIGSEVHKKNPELTWPQVAREVAKRLNTLVEFNIKGPRKAGEMMRVGVGRYEDARGIR